MFNQLTDETEFRVGALQQLLQIYQLTSDWQKAIEVAERLVKLGKDKQRIEIAHFYCELALQADGQRRHGSRDGVAEKRCRRR
ncbi:tetratricopeptide repeat protein [Salmonella enterica subsp. enterica]|uniref:Tetratricopeptide repeat protein n=1 Tax=Salmonella enterica I TaxID=59201 RepID=A0A379UQ74_SALET|nr:tetratricopeptide repeat protein [Salmonella enterica subsp. enterica]